MRTYLQALEYQRQYYKEHKEERRQYDKEHKEEIEERRRKIYTCECGTTLQHRQKASHNRSQKHLKFIADKQKKP